MLIKKEKNGKTEESPTTDDKTDIKIEAEPEEKNTVRRRSKKKVDHDDDNNNDLVHPKKKVKLESSDTVR